VTQSVEEGVTGVRQCPPEVVGKLAASRRLGERGDEVLVAQWSPSFVDRRPPDFAPVELRTSRLREDAPSPRVRSIATGAQWYGRRASRSNHFCAGPWDAVIRRSGARLPP
jgi:hypothetical protein